MEEKTKRALQDLVNKAEKLKRLDLDSIMREIGFGFRMNSNDNGSWDIEFDQPGEKDLDATLFTFRLFLQQGEPFSFHKFAQIAEDTALSENFRNELIRARKMYFEYLDGHPLNIEPNFFYEGEHPTREKILVVVLNGILGHTKNYQLRERYERWARDEIRENVLQQVFVRTVLHVLRLIFYIADQAEVELLATA